MCVCVCVCVDFGNIVWFVGPNLTFISLTVCVKYTKMANGFLATVKAAATVSVGNMYVV